MNKEKHKWEFIRQEKVYQGNHGANRYANELFDVFFCKECLAYKSITRGMDRTPSP